MNIGAIAGARRIDGSAYFDGTSRYFSVAASADLAPGTGDFTVEWFQYALPPVDAFARIFQVGPWPSKFGLSLESGGTGYIWTTGLNAPLKPFTPDPYLNRWQWFVMCRTNGVLHIFQQGKLKYREVNADDMNDTTNPLCIGVDIGYVTTTRYRGYISNFRYIKGTGLYSGATVDTVYYGIPAAPLEVVTNTKLLLRMDNSSSLATDSSGISNVSNVGGVAFSTV